jgi:predicted nucleic acid-binding protein
VIDTDGERPVEEQQTENSKPTDSNQPVDQKADDSATIRVVTKSVVSEGERSVAIHQAQDSVINTGDNVTIVKVNLSKGEHDATLTTSDIGAAVNLARLNQSLSSELSKRVAEDLENARESFREGKTRESFNHVKSLRSSQNWSALDDSVRLMILRALANMILSLRGSEGIVEAQSYLEQARSFELSDDATVRARIIALQHGPAAALAELSEPQTLDALNIRVGLLIDSGHIEEALREIALPRSEITLDAESYRLKAMALLLSCDIDGAKDAVTEALNRMPKRQHIRLAAAVIDYYLGLSRVALQRDAIPHPHPVNPAVVKRDDESQRRLKDAAKVFAEVAADMDAGGQAQKEVETWQIACLSNTSDGLNETVRLCGSALARDPANFRVLAWVLFRGYEIDLGPSEDALKKLLDGGDDKEGLLIHYVLALLGIYLKRDDTESVLALLDDQKALFETSQNLDLWLYWRGQALVVGKQPEAALQVLPEIRQQKLRSNIEVLALCEIANRDGSWDTVITHLEREFDETNDPQFLIHLCEIKAQLRDWNYVADRAEQYCDLVSTASSAYFAISAARSANRNRLCLRFLDKYAPLFPGGVLPENLRRVRAYCRLSSKDIGGALAEAEKLVGENDSVENIITLLDVLRAKGDLPSIEATARRLRNRELTALQCLQLADLVRVENSELAKELWRRAREDAQKDRSIAPFAVGLAFKLGLDNEIGSLWERVHEVAQSDDESIQLLDIQQILTIMQQHQSAREKIQEMYDTGEAPLALVAERFKRPMFDILNRLAEENASSPPTTWHLRPRIWIRHGARLLPPAENFRHSADWRLHADGSALILADQLGLLDKIEQSFRPIRISGKLPAALLLQRKELLDIQKTQLENCRTIAGLADQGKLKSLTNDSDEDFESIGALLTQSASDETQCGIGPSSEIYTDRENERSEQLNADSVKTQFGPDRAATLAAALRTDGFAVGLLPLQSYAGTELRKLDLPFVVRNRIINCRAIVDSLRGSDFISSQAFKRAIGRLGQEGNANISPCSPLAGAKLYLMEGVADVLAGADVLERACDNFEVSVTERCIQDARAALEEYARRENAAAQLQKLIQRISGGLEDGRYEFVSVSDDRIKETKDLDESENLDFAAMAELFLYDAVNWDVVWIDDRAINKHAFREGAPIIGINEVLIALREREVIDKHEYYETILKLRAQNFRYVPIDDDEILYHLRRAPIEEGVVTETQSLSVLRRYLSACLADNKYLQPDITTNGARNPFGESAFITNCLIVFTAAIAACWEDENASVELSRARADWILDNVYVGLFGVQHLQPNRSQILPYRLLGRDIAGLLMKAITIGEPLRPERRNEKRGEYFNWLAVRVTGPRFRSDRTALCAVARELERMYGLFAQSSQLSGNQRVVERLLLQKLFLDLPDEVRAEIDLDERTREWLGVATFSAAEVGGFTFDGKEFVAAVESALSGKRATIKPHGSDQEFTVVPLIGEGEEGSVGRTTLGVFDSGENQIASLGDPMLKILSPDNEDRKKTVEEFRRLFDGSDSEFKAKVDELVHLSDPHERLEQAHALEKESSEVFYQLIEQRLRRRDLRSNQLIPEFGQVILNRFRLPKLLTNDFPSTLEESIRNLLSDSRIDEAIERCACLPVQTPAALIDTLNNLPREQRQQIIDGLLARSASPITKLHLVNIMLRTQRNVAETRQILTSLYDNAVGEADFAAFAAIINFVNGEIEACRDAESISPPMKLAIVWAHASRIHNIFHSVGFSAKDIAEMFKEHTRQLNAKTMIREPELWDDCLHPHGLNRTLFLTHAVAKMLAGIDSNRLTEVGIGEMLEGEIELDVNGTKIPKLPLLHDSTLASDGLNSILGGDHAEALRSILNDGALEIVSSNKLKEIVKQALDQLVDHKDNSGWASIILVLGDLPIYPDLREECRVAISNLEIDAEFMSTPGLAHSALMTAANQVRHWGDEEMRFALRDKIVAAIKMEGEAQLNQRDESATSGDERRRRIEGFVDAVLKLSIVRGDLSATGRQLADVLGKISEVWPDFSKRLGPVVSAFLWELPVEVVQSWWPLCLKLRATLAEGW